MKLTIELIPQTSWYSNVRSNVSTREWERIRRKQYAISNNKCDICGCSIKLPGYNHILECHEIWDFNEETNVQTLLGFTGLCPMCHSTKHFGLAQIQGKEKIVTNHLMKINNISKVEAEQYIKECFELWQHRSTIQWELNIDYLNKF